MELKGSDGCAWGRSGRLSAARSERRQDTQPDTMCFHTRLIRTSSGSFLSFRKTLYFKVTDRGINNGLACQTRLSTME